MRRARLTWPGAFHHVFNRGHDREDIFASAELKMVFLELFRNVVRKMRLRVLAYCVMSNHFHLVLENTEGRLSEAMKRLCGEYGAIYRKITGGVGYVFQGRFRSTWIDDNAYLLQSILYLLQNPTRAGLTDQAEHYPWSSVHEYYSGKASESVDNRFVEELFGCKEAFQQALAGSRHLRLSVRMSRVGEFLADEGKLAAALERFERRNERACIKRKRRDDWSLEPVTKVIAEFEHKVETRIDAIETGTRHGQRLRADLLVQLRDQANMKYTDIAQLDLFSDLRAESLRSIYLLAKRRGVG
jgi:putative transposase